MFQCRLCKVPSYHISIRVPREAQASELVVHVPIVVIVNGGRELGACIIMPLDRPSLNWSRSIFAMKVESQNSQFLHWDHYLEQFDLEYFQSLLIARLSSTLLSVKIYSRVSTEFASFFCPLPFVINIIVLSLS